MSEQAPVDSIQLESELEVRAGIVLLPYSADGQACLAFGENTVSQDEATRPAMLRIVRERRFRVSDLPGLADNDRLRLCRLLFRQGLLALLGHKTTF